MSKIKDISEQRFGKLTAIEFAYIKDHKSYWLCLCDCGNTKVISRYSLIGGATQTCGCSKKENRKDDYKEAIYKLLYRGYRKNSKNEFELTLEEFKFFLGKPCKYCGKSSSNVLNYRGIKNTLLKVKYNGIDRVDSSKGYTMDNCVTCCYRCNYMKSNMSTEEFLDQIRIVFPRK